MNGPSGLAVPTRAAHTVLLVAVAGFVALTAVFSVLGTLLTGTFDADSGADADLIAWFVDIRAPRLDWFARAGSFLGSTVWVVGSIIVLDIVFVAVRRRWAAVALTTALVVEASVFGVVQLIVDRSRPNVEQLEEAAPTASYPSGHTAAATALYLTVGGLVSRPERWDIGVAGSHGSRRSGLGFRGVAAFAIAVSLALFVGLSRLYNGVHYPSDVLAALVLGLSSFVVGRLAVARALRDRVSSEAHDANSSPSSPSAGSEPACDCTPFQR